MRADGGINQIARSPVTTTCGLPVSAPDGANPRKPDNLIEF
jgi:hypothetical protein